MTVETGSLSHPKGGGPWDLVVAGGGNAALCAAITAAEAAC